MPEAPAPPATSADRGVERVAVGFVSALRQAGLVVPVGSTVSFVRALGELGAVDHRAVYWAGRATLVVRHEDIGLYDQVFRAYWRSGPALVPRPAAEPERITLALDDGDEPPPEASGGDDEEQGPVLSVRYSAQEVLRHRDFAECTDAELEEAHRLMARMGVVAAQRPSRRRRPAGQRGARIDLGRTLREALRSGGEATRLSTTAPGDRPRRLVLLADISGSMEPYARSLVRFVHAAVVGRARVEAFTLGTQLTRVTRELSSRDPDAAVARATDAVEDWSGGTRLGDMLREFNDTWGVRGMARGAVVVILSDGWDRGDPDVLAEQMARLHRVAHRVVWVNPLKATPGYEPLARGMAAALPFVDRFIEGHSLAALEHLAEEIAA